MSKKHHPPSSGDLRARIERTRREGKYQQALALVKQLYKSEPTPPHLELLKDTYLRRAEQLRGQGHLRDAATVLEVALRLDEKNVEWINKVTVEMDRPTVRQPVADALSSVVTAFRQLFTKRTTPLTFLLVGRTGVGKSSAINALLGCKVAPTSKYEVATQGVNRYLHLHDGVPISVVDTPGLCDALPEAGNDERYLDLIRAEVKEIDCLWYVTLLDDTRVRLDEQHGIHLITRALGPEIWHRAVIVFTFADRVPMEEYQQALSQRSQLIRKVIDGEIGKAAQGRGQGGPEKPALPQASEIPAVAVSNREKETPDGKPWLGELFWKVLTRVSDSGVVPFLVAMKDDLCPSGPKQQGADAPDAPPARILAHDLRPTGPKQQGADAPGAPPARIELSDGQKQEVRSTLLKNLVFALRLLARPVIATVVHAVLPPLLGPVGVALGGAVGTFVQWLAQGRGDRQV